MDQLELLWAYQQEDVEADRLENEIKRSPTRLKLVKNRDYLVEQQGVIKRIEGEVVVMSDRIDAIKDAIDRYQEQLNNLQARFEADPPKDVDAIKQLSADTKKLLGTITTYEQEMKRIRKDAADRDRQQHEIRVKAAKVKSEFDQLKIVYEKEYKEKMKALQAQRKVVAEKATEIDPPHLEKYNTIKRHCVPPIARLLNDQCGGCNMSMPSVVLRTIKSGSAIVECETCGRMIIKQIDK